MSQPPPPPPSWGGPPGNYPPPPPQWQGPPNPPSGLSNKAKFWIGVALAIPAMIVSGAVTGIVGAVVDSGGANPDASSAAAGLTGLLILAGFIVLVVVERTRWVAIGMLAGGAAALILAAGACIVLLVTVMGSYN